MAAEFVIEVTSFRVEYGKARVTGELVPDRVHYSLIGHGPNLHTLKIEAEGYDEALQLAQDMAVDLDKAWTQQATVYKTMTTLNKKDFRKKT